MFSVEKEENLDGSAILSVKINGYKKLATTTDGPIHMFAAKPEGNYLVDQFNFEGIKLLEFTLQK